MQVSLALLTGTEHSNSITLEILAVMVRNLGIGLSGVAPAACTAANRTGGERGADKQAAARYCCDAALGGTAEAEASTRQDSDWDYSAERAGLQATLNELALRSRRSVDVQLKAAQQYSAYMNLMQMYQQQIQQLQMAQYGQASPVTLGFAYRVPTALKPYRASSKVSISG